MARLWIDICYQNCFAVATNWVFENVSQLTLSIRHVFSFFITRTNDHLFEIAEWSIDISCFSKCESLCTSLFRALVARQINQIELRVDDFLWSFYGGPRLEMDGEDCVWTARSFVQNVVSSCTVLLTFEQTVQSLFLVTALNHSHSFQMYIAFCVILHRNCWAGLFVRGHIS